MSGHSKWKTIAHKKGAADAKRGQIFSKLSKELTIAARAGGGNPDMNPSLRMLMIKAKSSNMPTDNVERAVKKGTGELDGGRLEEIIYEGYAGGGVALVVKVLTDNKNRAASDVRHIFTKFGSNLAGQGAVMRNFKRKGQIMVDAAACDEDKLMSIVLDAGGEDMQQDDGMFEIITDPANYEAVSAALEKAGIKTASSEITLIPDSYMSVTDKTVAANIMKFIEALEDNDDVQNVYSNLDVDESILKAMEQAK
ncbi:MAG: YebC/PmpR family DNA-binding transcriptional regulator [Verrucomicrobia bacterium]|nr:YebC/PmpR family DNA-binding transcriptional regulator [Verrucomicrobiota bacterium]MBU4289593.1 YebC/PmpR family DNA-binding transcriptional regulator [Verrucomicrobiota bacterium]MBU4428271.1 YebC/PmpR family DNA-binding transcriptional regulator [Verrucomicrobiota bacterium]MCG2678735.1 YebC/PmpR family DNA-binding transcriptional regulator [Kiritimatiellia bacterium]